MDAVLSTVFCGQRTLLQLIAAWSVIRVRICARNGGSAHKAPELWRTDHMRFSSSKGVGLLRFPLLDLSAKR